MQHCVIKIEAYTDSMPFILVHKWQLQKKHVLSSANRGIDLGSHFNAP